MKSRLLVCFVLLLTVSCLTQEVCDEDSQSRMVVKFKTGEPKSESDTLISGLTLYGIREGKADSLLYDSANASRIELPLDPHHSFSRFVLRINKISDTLLLVHNTGFYLMSYDCGYGAVFTLDPDSIFYGGNLFYDFKIQDAVIDAAMEQDEEHLWLYF